MNIHEFTLTFSFSDSDVSTADLAERLGEAGCTDSLVGLGQPGRVALAFARRADSALEAVSTAVADVKKAIPDAKLDEATPDLIGLGDLEEAVGEHCQPIRKIMESGGPDSPQPVHEGRPTLWHLYEVLKWLAESKNLAVDRSLMEVARANMYFNLAKDLCEVDSGTRSKIFALVSRSGT